jgi:hypothetical protein
VVVLVLPIAIGASVLSRICREIKDTFYLAKLDVQGDIETAKQIWRR